MPGCRLQATIGPAEGPADVAADTLRVCPMASGFGFADHVVMIRMPHLDHGVSVTRARPVLHSRLPICAQINAARVAVAHVHQRASCVGEVEGLQSVFGPRRPGKRRRCQPRVCLHMPTCADRYSGST